MLLLHVTSRIAGITMKRASVANSDSVYLITAIGDIVWEIDTEARFVYVSPQVEAILGYTQDELIGYTPFEFLHMDTIP